METEEKYINVVALLRRNGANVLEWDMSMVTEAEALGFDVVSCTSSDDGSFIQFYLMCERDDVDVAQQDD